MKLDEAVKLHRANVMMMLAIIARCAIDERFEKATW